MSAEPKNFLIITFKLIIVRAKQIELLIFYFYTFSKVQRKK